MLKDATGKTIEVMIYGDGSFKDSVGKIRELADPVVSPPYTSGLEGLPNETKLKYLADHNFAHLRGEALEEATSEHIKNRDLEEEHAAESLGTTACKLTTVIGSRAG